MLYCDEDEYPMHCKSWQENNRVTAQNGMEQIWKKSIRFIYSIHGKSFLVVRINGWYGLAFWGLTIFEYV